MSWVEWRVFPTRPNQRLRAAERGAMRRAGVGSKVRERLKLKRILRLFSRWREATWSIRWALVHALWRRVWTQTALRTIFGKIGAGSVIYPPSLLANTEFIRVGRAVQIRQGVRLEVVLHGQEWKPEICIGDHVNIEQNVHIVCHDRITIEDNVSITGHCAIVDVTHPIDALRRGEKMGEAIDPARSHVFIGRNSFIGFGSIVLPRVRIGRNCVIGAGSVVACDIPDGSIAAGAPARVRRTIKSMDD